MSFNLLKELQTQLSSEVTQKVGNAIGEDQSAVQKGMDALLPSIVGSMISQASTKDGANTMYNMLQNTSSDSDVLSKVDLNQDSDFSEQVLKDIFGSKVNGVVDLICSESGMKKQSTSSLMKIAAPMALSVIGKKVKTTGMDISGFTTTMSGQSTFIKNTMPKGLSNVLGTSFDSVTGKIGKVSDSATNYATSGSQRMSNTVSETSQSGGSFFKKLIPVVLICACGVWAWNYFGMTNPLAGLLGTATEVTESTGETVGETLESGVETVVNATDAVAAVVTSFTLPTGEKIEFTDGSFGYNFASFLGSSSTDFSAVYTLDNLNFETGSATITEDSKVQLGNLATVLSAYPTVNVRFDGHTASQGNLDNNVILSQNRVEAVKNYLVSEMGVEVSRIETAGYGSDQPVASNNTPEDRMHNNRIDMVVTSR